MEEQLAIFFWILFNMNSPDIRKVVNLAIFFWILWSLSCGYCNTVMTWNLLFSFEFCYDGFRVAHYIFDDDELAIFFWILCIGVWGRSCRRRSSGSLAIFFWILLKCWGKCLVRLALDWTCYFLLNFVVWALGFDQNSWAGGLAIFFWILSG